MYAVMLCHWHIGNLVPSAVPIYQTMVPSHWKGSCCATDTLAPLCTIQNLHVRPWPLRIGKYHAVLLAPLCTVQNLHVSPWPFHIGKYYAVPLAHWHLCAQYRTYISDHDPFALESIMLCHWYTGTFAPSAECIYQTMTRLDSVMLCHWHNGTFAPIAEPTYQTVIPSQWIVSSSAVSAGPVYQTMVPSRWIVWCSALTPEHPCY
jgi:hypothetical protein